MSDRVIELLNRSSGAIIVSTFLLTSAALALGISLHSADRFFDLREWARAVGDCLRQL